MATDILPLSETFDFSTVPSGYVLCTNSACPLRQDCLRYLAGVNAPESLEMARCVMPKTLKDGQCRWLNRKQVVVKAYGFTLLYDHILKKDYTAIRKSITKYLHGAKMYYEYKRGERPLKPEQQQWIRDLLKSYGYECEEPFDRCIEDYDYCSIPLVDEE